MARRYNCYGKDDFGHKYDALVSIDPDGSCVLASDYAALEARCRDAAKLISDVVETPDQFETEWNKAAREWLASTSETGAEHKPCGIRWGQQTCKLPVGHDGSHSFVTIWPLGAGR